jgi:lipopolysaccharide export system protein LptA
MFSQFTISQTNLMELAPGAEKLIYNKETGEHRLIGNIHITFQSNVIYCDSASYFEKNSILKMYSNVHLNKKDTLNLYCDSLHYDSKTRKAKLWGNVRIRDRDFKITTDSIDFDTKNDVAIYRNGGRIESTLKKETLVSKTGYFYPKNKNITVSGNVVFKNVSTTMQSDSMRYNYASKKAFFFGPTKIVRIDKTQIEGKKGWYKLDSEEGVIQVNASIIKDQQYISGDSLYFNELKGMSIGKGNVYFSDKKKGAGFRGDKFYSSKKNNKSYLTGKAVIEYKLKNDTLFIHADTLFTFTDSLNQLSHVTGYYMARFYSHKTQGVCDSLIYQHKLGKIEMYNKPIVWSNKAELKGEKIDIYLKDTLLDRAEIKQNATLITEVEKQKLYNQVGGKKIQAYFNSANELTKVDVNGNAQTIYFPEENITKDSTVEIQRKGMSRLYSSDIKISIENNEFTKVVYVDQADGVFYPMEKINKEEEFIIGYSWNPMQRPMNKNDVFPKQTKESTPILKQVKKEKKGKRKK